MAALDHLTMPAAADRAAAPRTEPVEQCRTDQKEHHDFCSDGLRPQHADDGGIYFGSAPADHGKRIMHGVAAIDQSRDDDRWFNAAPLPRGANHVAVVADAGRVYALGGFIEQNRNPDPNAFAYDVAADKWTAIAPLSRSRGARRGGGA